MSWNRSRCASWRVRSSSASVSQSDARSDCGSITFSSSTIGRPRLPTSSRAIWRASTRRDAARRSCASPAPCTCSTSAARYRSRRRSTVSDGHNRLGSHGATIHAAIAPSAPRTAGRARNRGARCAARSAGADAVEHEAEQALGGVGIVALLGRERDRLHHAHEVVDRRPPRARRPPPAPGRAARRRPGASTRRATARRGAPSMVSIASAARPRHVAACSSCACSHVASASPGVVGRRAAPRPAPRARRRDRGTRPRRGRRASGSAGTACRCRPRRRGRSPPATRRRRAPRTPHGRSRRCGPGCAPRRHGAGGRGASSRVGVRAATVLLATRFGRNPETGCKRSLPPLSIRRHRPSLPSYLSPEPHSPARPSRPPRSTP